MKARFDRMGFLVLFEQQVGLLQALGKIDPPQPASSSRRSNLSRTRAALLFAARRLFIDKGCAETGTPEIVAAAGVTRGALYHHVADKQALFRTVVEQEAAALAIEAGGSTADYEEALALVIRGLTRAEKPPKT